jgi:lysophospholipase L1-like esterase
MRPLVASIFLLISQATAQSHSHGSTLDLSSLYPDSNLFIPNRTEWQIIAYKKRIKDFRKDPIGHNKIVFLGNSITEGGRNWNGKFGLSNIVNRGITGDITESMLARLDEIYYYKPLKVFLLIGINDVFDGVVPYSIEIMPERIARNIYKIADSIKSHSQDTEIFIYTLLPVDEQKFRKVRGFYPVHNYPLEKQINEINQKIIDLGKDREYQIINLFSLFIDEKDKMKIELFKDGLHLNEAGYEAWANHIDRFVKAD